MLNAEKRRLALRFFFLTVLLSCLALLSSGSTRSLILGTGTHTLETVIATQQQEPQRLNRRPKIMEVTPVDVAPEESDSEKRLARQYKNHRYDHPRGESLLGQLDGEVYGRVEETSPPEALPISSSDAVVVGRVVRLQPYLTETGTAIYTEFTIRVEEVFKNYLDTPITMNASITADRDGGVLRLADGRILRYLVVGAGSHPTNDKRYLLFLQRTHSGQDTCILAGYELRGNSIMPLEDGYDRSVYAAMTEADFLQVVRKNMSRFLQ